jgi:prepilin-type N-terminal cleavage/methylation domain-containing protein
MSPTGNSGFTLIELLVTMALAGMLLAVVPPLLDKGGDRARLVHDRRTLVGQLRLARSQAIAMGRDVPVPFDLSNRRFGIDSPQISFANGVDITLDSTLANPPEIRFFADGSASGAMIHLHNPAGDVVLQVDWLTGRIIALP